jgi:uncharacterized membrane protein YtjA (UPF0391 family)
MQRIDPKPLSIVWTQLAVSLLALAAALFGFAGAPGAATEPARILFFLFVALLIVTASWNRWRAATRAAMWERIWKERRGERTENDLHR